MRQLFAILFVFALLLSTVHAIGPPVAASALVPDGYSSVLLPPDTAGPVSPATAYVLTETATFYSATAVLPTVLDARVSNGDIQNTYADVSLTTLQSADADTTAYNRQE